MNVSMKKPDPVPDFILLMGVSGCGKTTVAERLHTVLGGVFLEGDSFHPPENVARMAASIPLQDADRWPWFEILREEVARQLDAGNTPVVMTCSALKRRYREFLFRGFDRHLLVFLRGSRDLIAERIATRVHEYMPADLLDSQFDALEEPGPGEVPLTIDIDQPADAIVRDITDAVSRADRRT